MALLTGRRLERALASPQYRDGHFHNPSGATAKLKGNQLATMADFFLGGSKRKPHGRIPVLDPRDAWAQPIETGLRVTWFGHSTLLLEIDGTRILVDPVFGERASPVNFAGPKRFHEVPATIEQLPPIDVILLSHDHHDHLDPFSVERLAKHGTPWVTSLGVGARLEAMGITPSLITELDWWESHSLPSKDLTLTATPAQHFSGRGLRDRNITLWSSFVITTPQRTVYYSADSGPMAQFSEIAKRFGPFDLSLVEIGAWHPAWGDIHLGPVEAVKAFEQLGGGTFLPVHWGTFDLALHPWAEPAETTYQLAEKSGVRLITPRIGEVVEPSRVERANPWWRKLS
jgi:L-ascorbate metabolism protein UlaG (beta-lactamase superfamily)